MELAVTVGKRVRALRDVHGVTADTVAAVARDAYGLGWQRSTVASIETGARGLSSEELLLLPLVLWSALGRHVALSELVDRDVMLTDRVGLSPEGFARLLAGDPLAADDLQWSNSREGNGHAERARELDPDFHGGAAVDYDRLERVEAAASGEAEHRTARLLGLDAFDVSVIAHRLWGRGLTAERDARVRGRGSETPTALRTRRGHVTRQLVGELRAYLEDRKERR